MAENLAVMMDELEAVHLVGKMGVLSVDMMADVWVDR